MHLKKEMEEYGKIKVGGQDEIVKISVLNVTWKSQSLGLTHMHYKTIHEQKLVISVHHP